jgi:hypothetical protein
MRIFKSFMLFAFLACVWVITLTFVRIANAEESEKLPLSSGYMPVEAPERPQNRITVSRGYMTNELTGKAEEIHIKTYRQGSRVISTGRIGQQSIRIDMEITNPEG